MAKLRHGRADRGLNALLIDKVAANGQSAGTGTQRLDLYGCRIDRPGPPGILLYAAGRNDDVRLLFGEFQRDIATSGPPACAGDEHQLVDQLTRHLLLSSHQLPVVRSCESKIGSFLAPPRRLVASRSAVLMILLALHDRLSARSHPVHTDEDRNSDSVGIAL